MAAEWRDGGYVCERCDGSFDKMKIHWHGHLKKWYCYHCIDDPTSTYQQEWTLDDLKKELGKE